MTFTSHIAASNCEARNKHYGIRVSESENVRVRGSLAEGNDAGGILFGTLMDGTRRITARDNLSRNNGGHGIDVASVGATDVRPGITNRVASMRDARETRRFSWHPHDRRLCGHGGPTARREQEVEVGPIEDDHQPGSLGNSRGLRAEGGSRRKARNRREQTGGMPKSEGRGGRCLLFLQNLV